MMINEHNLCIWYTIRGINSIYKYICVAYIHYTTTHCIIYDLFILNFQYYILFILKLLLLNSCPQTNSRHVIIFFLRSFFLLLILFYFTTRVYIVYMRYVYRVLYIKPTLFFVVVVQYYNSIYTFLNIQS